MKIEVTQEDIGKGSRCDCSDCPIALAIIRATKTIRLVDADYGTIFIGGNRYETPPKVKTFMWLFDRNKPVKPFAFELPIEP